MGIKLIVGLKNPGSAYEKTRHNAGAWFVEALAATVACQFKLEKRLHAEIADCSFNGVSCKLLLPTTFMNHSGLAAQAASNYYQINPEEILVVHDELDLPPGRVKLKTGNGHGGHNGLRDIIQSLSNSGFHRLRFGIGHPSHKDEVLNYVLGTPSKEDNTRIKEAIEQSIAVVPQLLSGDIQRAMNFLHT